MDQKTGSRPPVRKLEVFSLHFRTVDVEIHENSCVLNVERCVEKYGGKSVYGWRVNSFAGGLMYSLLHHTVWEDAEGVMWGVSPYVKVLTNEVGQVICEDTDFLPDPAAIPLGEVGSRKVLPTRYLPNTSDRRIVRACELLNRSEQAVCEERFEQSRYYDQKANEILHHFGCDVNSAPDIAVNSF